jgi:flagellar FliL protein
MAKAPKTPKAAEAAGAGGAPAEGADGGGEGSRRGLVKPLLIGAALAAGLGGGGFYAAWSGLLPVPGGGWPGAGAPLLPAADTGFVAIAPMVISLGPGARARHLRFSGALEVPLAKLGEVERQMPRVLDVLNGYLRAVDARAFDDPSALVRLRAQMLRRVQLVLGEAAVRDLLVTEFVLN